MGHLHLSITVGIGGERLTRFVVAVVVLLLLFWAL